MLTKHFRDSARPTIHPSPRARPSSRAGKVQQGGSILIKTRDVYLKRDRRPTDDVNVTMIRHT